MSPKASFFPWRRYFMFPSVNLILPGLLLTDGRALLSFHIIYSLTSHFLEIALFRLRIASFHVLYLIPEPFLCRLSWRLPHDSEVDGGAWHISIQMVLQLQGPAGLHLLIQTRPFGVTQRLCHPKSRPGKQSTAPSILCAVMEKPSWLNFEL